MKYICEGCGREVPPEEYESQSDVFCTVCEGIIKEIKEEGVASYYARKRTVEGRADSLEPENEMQKPLILLILAVVVLTFVGLALSPCLGLSIATVGSVFFDWILEAGAGSALVYAILWRSMRKRDGKILKLPGGVHVCGVLLTMLATAAVRLWVSILFGGRAAMDPKGLLQMFLFLVVPGVIAGGFISFNMPSTRNIRDNL